MSRRMPHEDARMGMIRFLLENGADPHASNCFIMVLIRGNAGTVRLFVKYGANVNTLSERILVREAG